MKPFLVITALVLLAAGPALAQGRNPNSSSAASGNAEQPNKPTQNSAGGGGGR